jgi:glycosyltransferase involved in cell wall biosynthesis
MSLLLVFDSHPVQYRVPVWQAMEKMVPGSVHVAYASDCSVKGHMDEGFGRAVAWDVPLMQGYPNTILSTENGPPLRGWASLTGKGTGALMDRLQPDAVLLTGLNYRYDLAACREARRRKIPVWLRCENQDESVMRSYLKAKLRSLTYRLAYRNIDRFFYIGELNRQHYLRHGVTVAQLSPARYGTVDRFAGLSPAEKASLANQTRTAAGILDGAVVVGFSGKLIPKKNPELLVSMLEFLPPPLQARIWLYFLGSGELQAKLEEMAGSAVKSGLCAGVTFAGFANQSQLPGHYATMDSFVLPSRRLGETWGLVANEAMQAGCAVIVSEAVGSGADFAGWDRFRVFPVEDARALAAHVTELSQLPRDFGWARSQLIPYSLETTAQALLQALESHG